MMAPLTQRASLIRVARPARLVLSGAGGAWDRPLAPRPYLIGGAPVRGPPAVAARSMHVWYGRWVT